jgi:hypothetical protein
MIYSPPTSDWIFFTTANYNCVGLYPGATIPKIGNGECVWCFVLSMLHHSNVSAALVYVRRCVRYIGIQCVMHCHHAKTVEHVCHIQCSHRITTLVLVCRRIMDNSASVCVFVFCFLLKSNFRLSFGHSKCHSCNTNGKVHTHHFWCEICLGSVVSCKCHKRIPLSIVLSAINIV